MISVQRYQSSFYWGVCLPYLLAFSLSWFFFFAFFHIYSLLYLVFFPLDQWFHFQEFMFYCLLFLIPVLSVNNTVWTSFAFWDLTSPFSSYCVVLAHHVSVSFNWISCHKAVLRQSSLYRLETFSWGWAYCSVFYFLSSLVLLENTFTVTMTFSFHLAYLTWADRAWLKCLLFSPIVPEMWLFVCLLVSERAQLFSVLKECQGWGWRSSRKAKVQSLLKHFLCIPHSRDLVKCPNQFILCLVGKYF